MPSSKVIKAETASLPICDFSFRPVSQGATASAADQADEGNAAFVPLEIFDPSEMGGRIGLHAPKPSAEAVPEIPGKFISDEELERGLQESYQRGLQDGKNLAERGLLNVFKSMRTASEELQQLREKVLRDSEDDLLALSIAVARRVIHHEISQNRLLVTKVIKAALRNLSDKDQLVVRVNPDDQALLTTSQDQGLRQELAALNCTLKPDASLLPGSCQVETMLGTVDASFEGQLEEIYRQMLEERTSVVEKEPAVCLDTE
jgi:flagellar assembly protein FliH